jgi:serine/threonine protein kinase
VLQHNILIGDDGRGQLCDFGLVRLFDWQGPRGLTTTTPYGGTLKYKAYELFRSEGNRNPLPTFASDVYALGCVIYEVLYCFPLGRFNTRTYTSYHL